MIAARITEPAVGASVWASGSQVWNGNIGTLMAKARKNARNAPICRPVGEPRPARRERPQRLEVEGADPRLAGRRPGRRSAVARIATSISSEPTSVYRTNLIVA